MTISVKSCWNINLKCFVPNSNFQFEHLIRLTQGRTFVLVWIVVDSVLKQVLDSGVSRPQFWTYNTSFLLLISMYIVEFSSACHILWTSGISAMKSVVPVEQNSFEFLSDADKLQWFWIESAFKNAPKFGFVTVDKIFEWEKKKTIVHQTVPLKPGECRFGEQGWGYMSPGKVLGILTILENQVTSISVQNSGERQSWNCLEMWSWALFAQDFTDLPKMVSLVLITRLLPASKHHRCSKE